jgi:multidrug transporter EmrE-like cation transporter
MRAPLVLLVLLSVLLSSGSQIMLKYGMTQPAMKIAMADKASPLATLQAIATSPAVLMGMVCFGLSAVVWLFVLAKIPLSTAYPFVALGIAITVIGGRFLFAEPVSMLKLLGVALVITGVVCVGSSG